VEDNISFATEVEMLIETLEHELLPIQNSAAGALALLKEQLPDLALVDVYLKGPETGVDLAKVLSLHNIPVIFMTSSTDPELYDAIHGLRPEAFLVKPFNLLTLKSAIEMALVRRGHPMVIGQAIDHWTRNQIITDYLFVSRASTLFKLKVSEIEYIEADGNYCYLHHQGKRYAIKTSLRKLKSRLGNNSFLQVSRSHVVNFHYIQEVDFASAEIVLSDQKLSIGAVYRPEIEQWINRI
jgi:DNA-binding LytR/AlgR family response regulator